MAGCGHGQKYEQAPSADPASLSKSFTAADAATKSSVDLISSNITAEKYDEALIELQKLYTQPGLTPDQQKAVLGVTTYVHQKEVELWKAKGDPRK